MTRRGFNRRGAGQQRSCGGPGCGETVYGQHRFCRAHFALLPFDYRRALAEAIEARAPHWVVERAAAAADYLKVHSPAIEHARRIGERPD